MNTKQIVEQNISTYLSASAIKKSGFCNKSQALEFIRKVNEYEGWGRCRKMIDCNCDEYQAAHKMLSGHFQPFEVSKRLAEAQSSSLTSFYTPLNIAITITCFCIDAYKKLNGVSPRSFLDPSAGTGQFEIVIPGIDIISTCEKDTMTREILDAMILARKFAFCDSPVPNYKKEMIHFSFDSYENIGIGTSKYDIIASNIPFGDIKVYDRLLAGMNDPYKWSLNKIHTYYFMKSLTLLDDGGIIGFITSRGFLSSPSNKIFREEMLKHGRVISVTRLPDNMFSTIDVGTDLIIYQKTDRKGWHNMDQLFLNGWAEDSDAFGCSLNNSEVILKKNQFGKQVYNYKYIGEEMAVELDSHLRSDLTSIVNIDNNNQPKPNMRPTTKPALAMRPTVKPTLAVAKASVKADEPKPTKPTAKPVLAVRPTMKPVVAVAKPKKSDWREELAALVNMYHNVDDSNRTQFRDAYNLITRGSNRSLHQLVADYGTALPSEIGKVLITLEQKDSEGKWIAADIFTKAVDEASLGVDNDAHAALAASLNKFGKVDMPFMQVVSKLTRDELVAGLEKQMYFNPITGCYEEADRFLSGDVVAKASLARTYLDNYKNGERIEAEQGVSALEAARPALIPFDDIDAQFGARWIPTSFYEDFLYYTDRSTRKDDKYGKISLTYSPVNDDYIGSAWVHKTDWSMEGYGADDVIMWALRGATPKFMTENSDGKKVPDEDKYQRANRLVDQIKQAWIDFISLPSSAYIRKECEKIYNERFNSEVRPSYDGSFQTFPDLHLENLGISQLYQSQKDCIWMLKRNGGGVAWHEVGTGKTLIMCISAYEMKRIGLVNKPLIIGMKANVAQIAETFRKAYPNAKLLFPKNADFSKDRRKEFFNQIKNNDWDCIIMSHDQFGQIPSAEITQMKVMQQRLDGLNDVIDTLQNSRFRGRQLSGIQKRRDNLQVKLEDMCFKLENKKDDVMDFREMGIDHIFVDESHCFKNLGFETRQDRVAGIGNSEGSQRAEKLLYAIRDIQDRKGTDLGATFLSGTIVTNSLSELYNVFNYLRPKALATQNIHSFDAWAAVFCQKKTDYEPNVVGKIVSKERFAAYVNLPELSRFLAQVTDYRTSTMCGIDAPKIEQHFDSAPPTPQQTEMLNNLVNFVGSGCWSDLGIKRESPANLDKSLMLCATNVARQTALDPRMLDNCQTYGDEEGCKVRRCAENIYRIYNDTADDKGTQFVFNDISTYDNSKWNMQQELCNILVNEYGVPRHEIAFINEATTNATRLALFDKMNKGEVRILIGSTTKLGTGVNAQERAVAIHHLDIPWRPSDMEQRNGRAVRKGNWLAKKLGNKVDVYIYATERTLDAYKFSLLKNKQLFIDQLNNGTLGVRRIDESVMQDGDKAVSYAEFLSIVSGNTDLLEKTRVDAKILSLEKDRQAFYRQRNKAVQDLEKYKKDIASLTEWIKYAKIDVKAHEDVAEDTVPVINDSSDMKEAGRNLYSIIDTFGKTEFTEIGKCGSLSLSVVHHGESNFFYIVGTTGQYYKCICKGNTTGILGKVGYEAVAHYPYETYASISKQIEQNEQRIKHLESQLPDLRSFSAKEWQGADELTDLYTRQRILADKVEGKESAYAS